MATFVYALAVVSVLAASIWVGAVLADCYNSKENA